MNRREGSPRSYACGYRIRPVFMHGGRSKKPTLQTARLSGGGFTNCNMIILRIRKKAFYERMSQRLFEL